MREVPFTEIYPTFDDFMTDYKEHTLMNEAGRYVRRTNPNSHWDWYQVGGRWDKFFGRNVGTKAEFGFKKLAEEKFEREAERYRKWHEAFKVAEPSNEQIARATKSLTEENWKDFEPAQKLFGNNPEKLAKTRLAFDALDWHMWGVDEAEEFFTMNENEYAAKSANSGLTFAFIDEQGKWNQKADMGWWGMTSDNEDDYPERFWSFIERLPEDAMLYMVDCHI